MKKVGLLLMLFCLTASMQAAVYRFLGTVDDQWSNVANWTRDGVAATVLPGTGDDVRILATCVYNDGAITIRGFQVGTEGAAGHLTINAGSITTAGGGGLLAIGFDAAGTVVINGGSLNFKGSDATIGCWENKGTLIMNGGSMMVEAALHADLYDSDPLIDEITTEVVLNGGSLGSHYLSMNDGKINITNGKLQPWYSDGAIPGYIASGRIVGFDGQGTATFDTVPWPHTVSAVHNMHPTPGYLATVAVDDELSLSWTNWDPNSAGDDVYVDVWFGTDPNKLGANYTKVVDAGQNTTTVSVNATTVGGLYYWQVDSYIYGDPAVVTYGNPNDPNADPNAYQVKESTLFKFTTTGNLPPEITDMGPDMITWTNEPVQLNTTVEDDGVSPLTYAWTAAVPAGGEPNVVFSDASVEDPIVTFTRDFGAVTLTMTVDDGFNAPVSGTVVMNVYGSPCSAAVDGPGLDPEEQAMDLFFDCQIDLQDFAVLAAKWLVNYELTAPVAVP